MAERGSPTRVPIKAGLLCRARRRKRGAAHRLGTKCGACGVLLCPRRAIWRKCMSSQTSDVEMEARGTLYSYTFVHLPLFGSTNMEHADGYGVGQIDLPGRTARAGAAGRQAGGVHRSAGAQGELDVLREDERAATSCIVRFRPVEGCA